MQKEGKSFGTIAIDRYNFKYLILTIFLIYFSDTQLFCYNANEFFCSLAEYLMVAVSILTFIKFVSRRGKLNYSVLGLLIVLFSIFVSGMVHGDFSGGYISKMCLYILGFSVCSLYDVRKIIDCYIKVMTWICAISLVGLVLGQVLVNISIIPTITFTNGSSFKWLFLTGIPSYAGARNFGPFTEPSRYQAYINIGLIFLLFKSGEKLDIKRIVIFLAALITTFSTTGYLAAAFIFLAFILSPRREMKTQYRVIFIVGIIAAIVLLFVYSDLFNVAVNKLSMGSKSSSFAVRYNSIVSGLRLIRDNFLFGTGISNAQDAFIAAGAGFITTSEASTYTNTILMGFSKFGCIVGIYYVLNLIKSIKIISDNIVGTILLFVSFFVMLGGISFLDSIFFNVIVFAHYGIRQEGKYGYKYLPQ